MRYLRKMRFTSKELGDLSADLDGYIWIAVDARKGMISAGDEYLADLRDVLLTKRSKVEDIFGLGLNLITGEIDYVEFMNRRNPQLAKNGEIAAAQKERIETLIRYFFGDLAPFKAERERPRNTRQPFQAIA